MRCVLICNLYALRHDVKADACGTTPLTDEAAENLAQPRSPYLSPDFAPERPANRPRGLFSSGGKRADAMYALLLENEALEEALYSQNEKLRQERTDSLKDQLRATSYRRVLMSQLMNDERIKAYVAEILDEKALPRPDNHVAALPAGDAKTDE